MAGAPAPAADGTTRHLVPGTPLPDLALAATSGEDVNLRQRPGAAIVYIYPWTGRPGVPDPPGWDDIPGAHGSTPQTQGFCGSYAGFKALNVEVFGLSGQDSAHQRELCARLEVPFAILSDAGFAFQAALSLPTFAAGEGRYLRRLTLYVRDGAIAHVFYPVDRPATHAAEVLAWLTPAPA